MAIEYTKVNPSEVATDVMHQRAMEAEERAFVAEAELERQVRLLSATPPGGLNAARESEVRLQALTAEKSRRRASRANGAAPLSGTDRVNAHAGFLSNWITTLEQQHAANTAVRNEQARLLELNGKSGLTEDERLEADDEKKRVETVLDEIEIAHELAIELQEQLTAPAPTEVVAEAPEAPADQADEPVLVPD